MNCQTDKEKYSMVLKYVDSRPTEQKLNKQTNKKSPKQTHFIETE